MSTATQILPANQQRQQSAVAAPQVNFDPRVAGFGQLLKADNFKSALRAILPKAITPERMIRVVLSAMTQQPKLMDCTPESVMLSVLRAGSMGLEPDGGPLGQGYLVPFWNGKSRRTECQFIPGYRGLVKLARNSGEVADVSAEVVFESDQFDYELGLLPKLTHKRNDAVADPGKLKFVYAVARFRDGERKFIVMNAREVEKIKQGSASKNKEGTIFGPWVDHESEMWKKSAVRRLAKLLPLSTDPVVAQALTSEHDSPPIDVGFSLPAVTDNLRLAAPEPEIIEPPKPAADSGERMPVTEVADLMAGCSKAGLDGLRLVGFLKANFGPNKLACDDLTPEEGVRLRSLLDKIIEPGSDG